MNLHERVGSDQRTAVLDLLSQALAGGYLTLGEFDQRTVAAHSAVTVGDLVNQLKDLPRQFHWMPHAAPALRHEHPGRDVLASTAVVLGAASLPMSLCLGLGGVLGIAAVILGRFSLRKNEHHSRSVLAIVFGLVGLALSLVYIAVLVFVPAASPSS
ncbi:DUF1707 SHOCT-like domain-containing protein [Micromonospora echinospora]|uniref:DUF1707 SHOCT-like domain-containing protein n=1 Tax=Micromonospora echinospora TaxID=1877 RepID=UPI0014744FB8|nr:DUF1707 domain-containing protein [Micromonospora echinospora]